MDLQASKQASKATSSSHLSCDFTRLNLSTTAARALILNFPWVFLSTASWQPHDDYANTTSIWKRSYWFGWCSSKCVCWFCKERRLCRATSYLAVRVLFGKGGLCYLLYIDVARHHLRPALQQFCAYLLTAVYRFFIKIPLIDYITFTLCIIIYAFWRVSAELRASFSYGHNRHEATYYRWTKGPTKNGEWECG